MIGCGVELEPNFLGWLGYSEVDVGLLGLDVVGGSEAPGVLPLLNRVTDRRRSSDISYSVVATSG